jgi:hypothetical protein
LLGGDTILNRVNRAQNLVPLHDDIETILKRFDIQFAGESDDLATVINGSSVFELIEKPKTLLRKRQRVKNIIIYPARNGSLWVWLKSFLF